jgi:hypothetical protein
MAPAWIGLAGAIVATLVSALVAVRQLRSEERLARLRSELEEEVLKRHALFDREPLAAAAFDLQSRLYNILQLGFFAKYGSGPRSEDAIRTTLFRLAQYFGWSEILRRDIQFLSFPEDNDTRRVAALQSQISRCFLSDGYGPALMIWADEQRALGERMIVEAHGKVLCMGYALFRDRCDDAFAEIDDESVRERLRDAQHLLCELVLALDNRGVRYHREALLRA